MSAPEATQQLLIAGRQEVASGVIELELRSNIDGVDLPGWEAGAHIDLVLDDSTVRQYSLCGGDSGTYRIAVLREEAGRGGSRRVHELAVGDLITVGGPRNHFALERADSYLFIAGGIGITPIVPMIDRAIAEGASWHLLYGGRSRDSMAFRDRLESFGNQVTIAPMDEVGLLDLRSVLDQQPVGTMVYCCGPEALLDAVEKRCVLRSSVTLKVERFAPKPDDKDQIDVAFSVDLEESGVTLEVPADRSLVDVLREAGIDVLTSCEEGTCGTCETKVLAGAPDHRDSILSEAEQAQGDCMMVCVSRARTSSLTLQL